MKRILNLNLHIIKNFLNILSLILDYYLYSKNNK